jgi:hypothetical protein
LNEIKGFELNIQKIILEKTVGHSMLQSFLPEYFRDLDIVKSNQAVVDNMNSGMTAHLTGVRRSHSLMAKDIVCTLASSQSAGSSRGLVKVFGVNRRNIKKAIQRREMLDTANDSFWISYKRATRSDILQDSVRLLVITWWTEQSTISPEREKVLQKRIGVKNFDCHSTHYIHVSQVSSYSVCHGLFQCRSACSEFCCFHGSILVLVEVLSCSR